jgi:heme exporter protein CcmD
MLENQEYFVALSYGVSALVIAGLILRIALSARHAKARVAALEKAAGLEPRA